VKLLDSLLIISTALALCASPGISAVASTGELKKDDSRPADFEQPTDHTAVKHAGNNSEDSLTIGDIRVEGNRLVPTEDILHEIKTARGDKFDRDAITEDLKSINKLGYFEPYSLQVAPELMDGNKVLLKFGVHEYIPVSGVFFKGNQVVSNETLTDLVVQLLGRPQNLQRLEQAIKGIEKLYLDQGYTNASVTDATDDDNGVITITLTEGSKSKVTPEIDIPVRGVWGAKTKLSDESQQLIFDVEDADSGRYFQTTNNLTLFPSNNQSHLRHLFYDSSWFDNYWKAHPRVALFGFG
jgi:outer membrane protein assembly factor BamA